MARGRTRRLQVAGRRAGLSAQDQQRSPRPPPLYRYRRRALPWNTPIWRKDLDVGRPGGYVVAEASRRCDEHAQERPGYADIVLQCATSRRPARRRLYSGLLAEALVFASATWPGDGGTTPSSGQYGGAPTSWRAWAIRAAAMPATSERLRGARPAAARGAAEDPARHRRRLAERATAREGVNAASPMIFLLSRPIHELFTIPTSMSVPVTACPTVKERRRMRMCCRSSRLQTTRRPDEETASTAPSTCAARKGRSGTLREEAQPEEGGADQARRRQETAAMRRARQRADERRSRARNGGARTTRAGLQNLNAWCSTRRCRPGRTARSANFAALLENARSPDPRRPVRLRAAVHRPDLCCAYILTTLSMLEVRLRPPAAPPADLGPGCRLTRTSAPPPSSTRCSAMAGCCWSPPGAHFRHPGLQPARDQGRDARRRCRSTRQGAAAPIRPLRRPPAATAREGLLVLATSRRRRRRSRRRATPPAARPPRCCAPTTPQAAIDGLRLHLANMKDKPSRPGAEEGRAIPRPAPTATRSRALHRPGRPRTTRSSTGDPRPAALDDQATAGRGARRRRGRRRRRARRHAARRGRARRLEADAVATAKKIASLRFFPGATPMDRTLAEVGGGLLVVAVHPGRLRCARGGGRASTAPSCPSAPAPSTRPWPRRCAPRASRSPPGASPRTWRSSWSTTARSRSSCAASPVRCNEGPATPAVRAGPERDRPAGRGTRTAAQMARSRHLLARPPRGANVAAYAHRLARARRPGSLARHVRPARG